MGYIYLNAQHATGITGIPFALISLFYLCIFSITVLVNVPKFLNVFRPHFSHLQNEYENKYLEEFLEKIKL